MLLPLYFKPKLIVLDSNGFTSDNTDKYYSKNKRKRIQPNKKKIQRNKQKQNHKTKKTRLKTLDYNIYRLHIETIYKKNRKRVRDGC